MEANNTQSISPLVVGFAIAAGAVWGGTGIAERFNSTSTNHRVETSRTSPNLSYRMRIKREQASLDATEVLKGLQDRLGLRVSQLAQVAHASRPTIYGWLKNGEVQRDDKVNRLSELMKVVEVCDRGDIDSKSINRLLRRQTKFGSSMLELLSEPNLDLDTIREAYQGLKSDAQASHASMQRMAKKRKALAVKHTPEEMGDNLSQIS